MKCAIRLAVTTVLLAIVLRTWLVMGLIEPVTVAGSSMAPTLRGTFAMATCPSCQMKFAVGAEFAGRTESTTCPHCGQVRIPLASSPLHRGDRLWIDRAALDWRKPRRWEVVVLRRPDDGSQLCVKRVVALPGETVRLSAGDLWVNGRIFVKSLAEQFAMRQVVSRSGGPLRDWQTMVDSAWRWTEGSWRHTANDSKRLDWLRYVHWDQQPLTDDVSYNAGLSRKLNLVRDFMLTADVRAEGTGLLALELGDGRQLLRLTICPSTGAIVLSENGAQRVSKMLSASIRSRLNQGAVSLVLSNFDRQVLLALDGHVELRHQLAGDLPPAGTGRPFAIGTQGLGVSLKELTIFRDVYYSRVPVGARPQESEAPIRLGQDQYFVLGDNPPISVDSRIWGPVSGCLLLGKPLGVR